MIECICKVVSFLEPVHSTSNVGIQSLYNSIPLIELRGRQVCERFPQVLKREDISTTKRHD